MCSHIYFEYILNFARFKAFLLFWSHPIVFLKQLPLYLPRALMQFSLKLTFSEMFPTPPHLLSTRLFPRKHPDTEFRIKRASGPADIPPISQFETTPG